MEIFTSQEDVILLISKLFSCLSSGTFLGASRSTSRSFPGQYLLDHCMTGYLMLLYLVRVADINGSPCCSLPGLLHYYGRTRVLMSHHMISRLIATPDWSVGLISRRHLRSCLQCPEIYMTLNLGHNMGGHVIRILTAPSGLVVKS